MDVLIVVKRNIPVKLLTIENNNIRHVFIKIKCLGDIGMRYVYTPPLSTTDTYNNHLSTISYLKDKYPNCEFLVMGTTTSPAVTLVMTVRILYPVRCID